MKRNVTMEEISDGRLYRSGDMVKAGCRGCGNCCRGMGRTIVLDPLDIYQMISNLKVGFEELMKDKIELNVAEGVILPNIKMRDVDDACGFLDENNRCAIHSFRPGICRLFPLGRYYAGGSFQYFLQTGQCQNPQTLKIKVKKWLGISQLEKWEAFIIRWHFFLRAVSDELETARDDNLQRRASLYILQRFYMEPYETENFFEQVNKRLEEAALLLLPSGWDVDIINGKI